MPEHFEDELRRLDRGAQRMPWDFNTYLRPGDPPLVYFLRNHAVQIADLVEAVRAYFDTPSPIGWNAAVSRLAALDAEAGDV